MLAYIAECDRQTRVYGGSGAANPQTPQSTPNPSSQQQDEVTPRGIAAIPLLCAAASESRVAYLRRLSRTHMDSAWWARQESLCGTPGTLSGLPETVLLAVASLVEYVSLGLVNQTPLPPSVVQSLLWPLHNACLAIWMLLILIFTAISGGISLATTILWGSRRTGISLQKIWNDELIPASQSVNALCQPQQPISVRLVGLILLPLTPIVEGLCRGFVEPVGGQLATSVVYGVVVLFLTWWYWIIVAPWLGFFLMVAAFWSGCCFALIEMAGM